jgi:hypothetical protein
MALPLYELLDTTTKLRVQLPLPLGTLRMAQAMRRACNKRDGDPLRYVVVPGPAHPKYLKK